MTKPRADDHHVLPRQAALNARPEVAAGCPRPGNSHGPRVCEITDCRYHVLHPVNDGPWRPPRLGPYDDHCALDKAARIRDFGEDASLRAIGRVLGCDARTVHDTETRALRKLAIGFGVSPADLLTRMRRR